jgi:hypothetical protein
MPQKDAPRLKVYVRQEGRANSAARSPSRASRLRRRGPEPPPASPDSVYRSAVSISDRPYIRRASVPASTGSYPCSADGIFGGTTSRA